MKLEDLRESLEYNVNFKRIHSLPIEEKKKHLKKRANKDYEKNHKEKKKEMDKEHLNSSKEFIQKKKDQFTKQH